MFPLTLAFLLVRHWVSCEQRKRLGVFTCVIVSIISPREILFLRGNQISRNNDKKWRALVSPVATQRMSFWTNLSTSSLPKKFEIGRKMNDSREIEVLRVWHSEDSSRSADPEADGRPLNPPRRCYGRGASSKDAGALGGRWHTMCPDVGAPCGGGGGRGTQLRSRACSGVWPREVQARPLLRLLLPPRPHESRQRLL